MLYGNETRPVWTTTIVTAHSFCLTRLFFPGPIDKGCWEFFKEVPKFSVCL